MINGIDGNQQDDGNILNNNDMGDTSQSGNARRRELCGICGLYRENNSKDDTDIAMSNGIDNGRQTGGDHMNNSQSERQGRHCSRSESRRSESDKHSRQAESKSRDLFLALLRAGLWENGTLELSPDDAKYMKAVCELAFQQSVAGLVAAGLEHVACPGSAKFELPMPLSMKLVSTMLAAEKRNGAMNRFIAELLSGLDDEKLNVVLVKGQGIAQCYERPLWRASGDIDLLVDGHAYARMSEILAARASRVEKEDKANMHFAMTVDGWEIELHGKLNNHVSSRADRVVDKVKDMVLAENQTRIWHNGGTDIRLPSPDCDAVLVFSHILQHYFRGGIGLRQICDWCRLLSTCASNIDRALLESRIREMGMMTEWKSFAALAVDHLGMPEALMPMYDRNGRWSKKARGILEHIFETGNFGHNRDNSYFRRYPFVVRKFISLHRHTRDIVLRHLALFPLDSIRLFFRMLTSGLRSAAKGI